MSNAHDDHAADHGGGHIAHTLPVSLLVGVWVALMVLTGATVYFASLGLGAQLSFTVAMIIASVKAAMVMGVFMHLWWDKKVNVLFFVGSFLFVLLFISMALTDKAEYKPDIDRKVADDIAAAAAGK